MLGLQMICLGFLPNTRGPKGRQGSKGAPCKSLGGGMPKQEGERFPKTTTEPLLEFGVASFRLA